MTRYLVYASIFIASLTLTLGFALAGHISTAITLGLLGLLWGLAYSRGLSRFNGLALTLFVLASVMSIAANASPWFALAAITFSLIAWDLTNFLQRLQVVRDQEDYRRMERGHLVRLTLVIGLGVFGFVTATQLRISLTFGGAALLALLAIWGISALVYRLRSHE